MDAVVLRIFEHNPYSRLGSVLRVSSALSLLSITPLSEEAVWSAFPHFSQLFDNLLQPFHFSILLCLGFHTYIVYAS